MAAMSKCRRPRRMRDGCIKGIWTERRICRLFFSFLAALVVNFATHGATDAFVVPVSSSVVKERNSPLGSSLPSKLENLIGSSTTSTDNLPIYDVLADIQKSTSTKQNLLLEAPPGAGKTTVVPLAMLYWRFLLHSAKNVKQVMDEKLDTKSQIWLVEPRRVAVRSAANRMSQLLGEQVGETIGYQMRGESRGGPQTQINVVTDGILLQRLRSDPELTGISVILFDEFHERNCNTDVALALCRQTQQVWREDERTPLQIVVMSATLLGTLERSEDQEDMPLSPATKLVQVLGGPDNCDVLKSDGRQYPIKIQHSNDLKWKQARPLPLRVLQKDRKELVNVMCDAIQQGVMRAPAMGDVLVFLPGAGEIRRTLQQLQSSGYLANNDIEIVPLYGALPKDQQDYALYPSSDRRRVIISSPIAEASLTLERVTCVVDSGLRREPRCDVDTNMPRLITTICSKASATQRAGRAGRVREGLCLRIYSESEFEASMPEQADPEILSTDLCPTTLLLTEWGCSTKEEILTEIPFVDPPPRASLDTAVQLLVTLGSLHDKSNTLAITALGRKIAAFPTHPRIATVLQTARESKDSATIAGAVAVAFMLDNEMGAQAPKSSLNLADCVVELFKSSSDPRGSYAISSFRKYAARLGGDFKTSAQDAIDGKIPLADISMSIGRSLLAGFIDLIGERKGDASYGGSTYLLSLGRSARLDSDADSSADSPPFVVVADTSTSDDGKVRMRAYAAVDKDDLMARSTEREIAFTVPSRGHEVRARRVRMVGSLELEFTPLPLPSQEMITSVLKETIESLGGYYKALTQVMAPDKRAQVENLCQRVQLASRVYGDTEDRSWPAIFLPESNETIWEEIVEPWLAPAGSLKKVDLFEILWNSLTPDQQWQLDRDFPVAIQAPDGSQIPISYAGEVPSATAKLQQFFGTSESPFVGPRENPHKVSLLLLSPGGKVVAQTIDLPFFWKETYPQVRAELRGRYAKHPWPEDPVVAQATRKTKKQMAAAGATTESGDLDKTRKSSSKKRGKKRK